MSFELVDLTLTRLGDERMDFAVVLFEVGYLALLLLRRLLEPSMYQGIIVSRLLVM